VTGEKVLIKMSSTGEGDGLPPPAPCSTWEEEDDDDEHCPQCGVEYDDKSYLNVACLAECGHLKCHRCVKKWWLDCIECEQNDNEYIANYPPNWPWHKPTWGDLKGTEEQCKFSLIIRFSHLPSTIKFITLLIVI